MVSLARRGQAKGSESVYFVAARSTAPVDSLRSLRTHTCRSQRCSLCLHARNFLARVVDRACEFLSFAITHVHARTRAQAFVARMRVGDALWVHEHAVMYMREIHHIALEVG